MSTKKKKQQDIDERVAAYDKIFTDSQKKYGDKNRELLEEHDKKVAEIEHKAAKEIASENRRQGLATLGFVLKTLFAIVFAIGKALFGILAFFFILIGGGGRRN